MSYLKALGVLRLVSEQADSGARGWWKDECFHLRSVLDRSGLEAFFLDQYSPTPILVPWSGSDFFDVDWSVSEPRFRATPTAARAIEAVLGTKSERFLPYRKALRSVRNAMIRCGMTRKQDMGNRKWDFIRDLRSHCEEAQLLGWIDAAAAIGVDKFAALLGSGGGSDGNAHFSDNFMQNLWDILPEFDEQRRGTKCRTRRSVAPMSRSLLGSALFGDSTEFLVPKRTSALYDAGAVGGANATQGMSRASLSNPWSVILALEGAVCFAGAVAKRLGTGSLQQATFPFQFAARVTSQDHLAIRDGKGRELWLPLWVRPASLSELLSLLREGRAESPRGPAASGMDMALAIATLGVDRGIQTFQRYVVLKGRVGGDNYNTSTCLGSFQVTMRSEANLLDKVDPWLDSFRKASRKDGAPPRFAEVLRAVQSAVFDFCKYGGASRFQAILVALGAAEKELLTAEKFRSDQRLRPLAGLSSQWIEAADDGSSEFEIALALASLYDPARRVGPLRANLEPVDWQKRCRVWAEKNRSVVWSGGDCIANLGRVLERRVMDGKRHGCELLPLATSSPASLASVAAFLHGDVDPRRVEELLRGLVLVDMAPAAGRCRRPRGPRRPSFVLPREYALLKLLFLPAPILPEHRSGSLRWRLARGGEDAIRVRSEPRVLPLLRADRVGDACRIAAQRLRSSRLAPMPGPVHGKIRDECWAECGGDGRRLAAALLVPVSSSSIDRLIRLVCRPADPTATEATAVLTKGD